MKELPKLPYGQGVLDYNNGTIRYRKRIKFSDGTYIMKSVNGNTVQECFTKMSEYEKRAEPIHKKERIIKQCLDTSILNWLNNYKKNDLKPQSYQRLKSTIENHICKSNIAKYQYNQISSDELQTYINSLNNGTLSYSSIKKVYDALNAYYKHTSIKENIRNPMVAVIMPTKNNIQKTQSKEIEFFEAEDIKKFTTEAVRNWNTGSPRYKGGHVYAANIYMGLRIGELLALTWKDIDFNNNTVHVNKTLIEYVDPATNKTIFEIQPSTKTNFNRYVPLNNKAKKLLLDYKAKCIHSELQDYVISTRNRKTTTTKNASDTIKRIEINANMNVQSGSTHTIRHTCASLYFKNGVQVEIIAKILGHSPEVCRSTYIHFVEEQLKEAASKLNLN